MVGISRALVPPSSDARRLSSLSGSNFASLESDKSDCMGADMGMLCDLAVQ